MRLHTYGYANTHHTYIDIRGENDLLISCIERARKVLFGAWEDSSVGKVFSGQAQGPALCSLPLLTHELVMEGSKETGGVLGLANHSS